MPIAELINAMASGELSAVELVKSLLGRIAALDHSGPTLRSVIELNPAAAGPRLGLIQAYSALGRADLAREQYDALKTIDPGRAAQVPAGSLRPD